ncbi:serine hydrolase domain-containing protein [Flavobacterium sp. Fl-318]|uniref:Serine hydrolase domain-containing protein n=1 Tax=Flavobacterium cupriresistens TaxID=2893885 RepID=A0ABU4RE69_9FLAO|nr:MULTISPECIES: serine hydrolase domain-containing protein [unclassified Flavobacterium]MDX6190263.1 serine hydrolase domain-containing protein [Flavobacterium sp. Fl-318]UFH43081.1 beta-lactamase family protein [Flavobacterium sp. F-323]
MNSKTEESVSKISRKELDVKLKKIYKKSSLPGFAVGIIKKDTVYFSEGYGWANVKDKVPFTKKTIMPIASVSKTFIGFAVVKAIELGYFTPETPINEILPYAVINPNFPEDNIRVKHLFTHTSGIVDVQEVYAKTYQINKIPDIALAVFLNDYLTTSGKFYSKNNFDVFKAGGKYNYSNITSALMAHLIEIKSGLSFDEFTQQYLFQPLELKNTHWFYNKKKSKKYAALYEVYPEDDHDFKDFINPDKTLKTYCCVTYPDGSLRSTVKDLSLYVIEMLKGLEHNSDILSSEYYDLLFQKQFDEGALPVAFDEAVNQAVFWGYDQKNIVSHGGADPGVATLVSIDLENKIGRIIFVNCAIMNKCRPNLIEDFGKIFEILSKVK